MKCLLDAAAAMLSAETTKQQQSRDALQEKWSYPLEEEMENLIQQREKNWEEFLACADQPNVVFVGITMKIARGYPVDVLEMPFLELWWMESEMLFRDRSSRRLRASLAGANRATVRNAEDMSIESKQYGWGKDYPKPGQRGEMLAQGLQDLRKRYPDRRLILVDDDLRPMLRIFELDCPKAATYFADAIDMGWVWWSATPDAGQLGHTEPKGEPPRYNLFDTNDPNGVFEGGNPFHFFRDMFDLPEDRAPGRYRIGPDLVVKPEPDAPYAAKIYSQNRSRLPGMISSTVRLADYIQSLRYRPERVGTWGSAHISLWCKSTPDVRGTGSLYGWVCFEDLASLEAFVAQVDGTKVGSKTVEVVSLYTPPKPASPTLASLTSSQTPHEEPQKTLSLEGTEVHEGDSPRSEKHDGLGEELRLIETLDLGEGMDLGELMNFTLSCQASS